MPSARRVRRDPGRRTRPYRCWSSSSTADTRGTPRRAKQRIWKHGEVVGMVVYRDREHGAVLADRLRAPRRTDSSAPSTSILTTRAAECGRRTGPSTVSVSPRPSDALRQGCPGRWRPPRSGSGADGLVWAVGERLGPHRDPSRLGLDLGSGQVPAVLRRRLQRVDERPRRRRRATGGLTPNPPMSRTTSPGFGRAGTLSSR